MSQQKERGRGRRRQASPRRHVQLTDKAILPFLPVTVFQALMGILACVLAGMTVHEIAYGPWIDYLGW